VLTDAALYIDDVELALLASFIRGRQTLDHLRRRDACAQQLQTLACIVGIDQRLRRERAHAALRARAQRAGGEEARRDRDPERAARCIAGDDRPGHGAR